MDRTIRGALVWRLFYKISMRRLYWAEHLLPISVTPFAHSEYTPLTCPSSSCPRAFESYKSDGIVGDLTMLLQAATAAIQQRAMISDPGSLPTANASSCIREPPEIRWTHHQHKVRLILIWVNDTQPMGGGVKPAEVQGARADAWA